MSLQINIISVDLFADFISVWSAFGVVLGQRFSSFLSLLEVQGELVLVKFDQYVGLIIVTSFKVILFILVVLLLGFFCRGCLLGCLIISLVLMFWLSGRVLSTCSGFVFWVLLLRSGCEEEIVDLIQLTVEDLTCYERPSKTRVY